MNGGHIAQSLGWCGVGPGLAELLAPRAVARAVGLDRHAAPIQLLGFREIASGVAILAADDPRDAPQVRVAGHGMDGAVPASGLGSSNRRCDRTLLPLLAAAPVVLDAVYALRFSR